MTVTVMAAMLPADEDRERTEAKKKDTGFLSKVNIKPYPLPTACFPADGVCTLPSCMWNMALCSSAQTLYRAGDRELAHSLLAVCTEMLYTLSLTAKSLFVLITEALVGAGLYNLHPGTVLKETAPQFRPTVLNFF